MVGEEIALTPLVAARTSWPSALYEKFRDLCSLPQDVILIGIASCPVGGKLIKGPQSYGQFLGGPAGTETMDKTA